jgi:transposase InsO family protein
MPATFKSDRGQQFTSAICEVFCKRLGIHDIATTAYHPQSNGMVQRPHRQLKDALPNRLAGDKWVPHLPWFLLGLRAAPKDDGNVSFA